ncbi:MAG: protein kinase [Planctomycetota bacterium]|nr:protein kinase [Planctomycetota bacterium]
MASAARVIANCKIVGKIGAGGMGSVYRAVHTTLGRKIALKVLPSEFTRSPEYVARFLREARAIANLSHPNVVAVHDAGESEGLYYIAMELIEGASLGGLVRDHGPLPESTALEFFGQAVKGLGAAHKHGLIHRDIKPENILVNLEGTVKIVDFGLVLESSSQSHLTRTGTFLGTPTFMSPEQCDGDVADVRSDLYSMGASFFALLTGQPPFTAPTALGVLYKHKFEATPDPRTLVNSLHEETCKIVFKLMAKNREERYQSAEAAQKDIQAALKIVGDPPAGYDVLKLIEECAPKAQDLAPDEMTPGPTPLTHAGAGSGSGSTHVPMTATEQAYPTQSPSQGDHLAATMISPGPTGSGSRTQATPGPRNTSGFEPTMMQSPGPHTPRPGPIAYDTTPAGRQGPGGASLRKVLVLSAVAAVVLIAVAGGGFWAYRNSQLNDYLAQSSTHLNEGKVPDALRVVNNGLREFPGNDSLVKRKQEIHEKCLELIQALQASSEFAKPYQKHAAANAEAVKALGLFPGDEKFAAIEKQELGHYEASVTDAVNELLSQGDPRAAKALAQEAYGQFRSSELLRKLENTAIDALVSAGGDNFIKWQSAMKEGEDLYQSGKLEEALTKFEQANLVGASIGRLEGQRRRNEVGFERLKKLIDAADKERRFQDALARANEALQFNEGEAQLLVIRYRNLANVERLRKTAQDTIKNDQDYDMAAETVMSALTYAGDDAVLRKELQDESNRIRADGFVHRAQQYIDQEDWAKAVSLLNQARSLLPQDQELDKKFQEARKKFVGTKKFKELLQEGKDRLSSGNFPEAKTYFESCLEEQKDNAEALTLLNEASAKIELGPAIKAAKKKLWEDAQSRFESVDKLAKLSKNGELIADVTKRAGDVRQKLEELAALEKLAAEQAKDEAYDEAIKSYDKLTEEHPAHKATYEVSLSKLKNLRAYKLGIEDGDGKLDKGQWVDAQKAYQDALGKRSDEIAKRDVELRLQLVTLSQTISEGQALLKEADKGFEALSKQQQASKIFERAQEAYKKSGGAELPPKAAQIKGRLDELTKKAKEIGEKEKHAGEMKAQKRWAEALADYEELKKLNPLGEAAYEKILVYVREQDRLQKEFEKNQARFNGLMGEAQKELGSDATLDQGLAKAKEALAIFATDATNGPNFTPQANALITRFNQAIQQRKIRQVKAKHWGGISTAVKGGNYTQAKSQADTAVREVGGDAGELSVLARALAQMVAAEQALSNARSTLANAQKLVSGSPVGEKPEFRNELDQTLARLGGNLEDAKGKLLAEQFAEAERAAQALAGSIISTARGSIERVAKNCKSEGDRLKSSTALPPSHTEVGESSLDTGNSTTQKVKDLHKKGDKFVAVAAQLSTLATQLR